jgi:hypothetical protein
MSTQLNIEELTDDQIDELIGERVNRLMKEDPTKFLQYLVLVAGRECVNVNAETMNLETEATYYEQRYRITTKIKVKKIKK